MKITNLFLLLVFITSSNLLLGQKKLDHADATYNTGEYYNAIEEYKDAYSEGGITDKEKKTEVIYKIADCYRRINQSKKAEMWFLKAIKKEYSDPIVYLYYAEALKMDEKYEEAVEQFKKYRELVPDDRRGDDGIKSCELALVWINNPNGYEINELKYFNSKSNDFSPCYSRQEYDRVYFTSLRESADGNVEHGATGQNFADIYESRRDAKGSWSEPVPLGENINSEFEDGACTMSKDFKTMYFTRCNMSKKKKYGCQLYWASRNGEVWGKAQEIKLSEDSILIAQPAVSPDDLILYFVSDQKGSIEESPSVPSKDIWRVTRESAGSEWGEMENLGSEINTQGNEEFPYVHADGTLYFSSDGHIGMGGLDIFKAKGNESGTWTIENMRYPINSSQDDFGVTFENDIERGYLSSTRDMKSDNIYSFYLPPLKFNFFGIVKDDKTDEPIPYANIKSISSDGITIDVKAGDDGRFKFILLPSTDYVFVISQKNYLNGKQRETTKSKTQSEDFSAVIYLQSTKAPIKVEDIFYEYDSDELMPESMVSLDKLVETLNDNPNVTIELMANTDSRGSDNYNDDLSQRRAQSVVDYLIENGISSKRLVAKGYGKRKPVVVNQKVAKKYPFFFEGDILTEEFINKLATDDQKEIANQLNRRTEFKVLRTDFAGK